MNSSARENHYIIKDNRGLPVAVVVPYKDYAEAFDIQPLTVPAEVFGILLDKEVSWLAAWRIHKGMSQADVAKKLGRSKSTYSGIEQASCSRPVTLEKVAAVLGIDAAPLIDLYHGEN